MSEKSPSSVLVCATMWWPLSARLAMAFLRRGGRVAAVCPPGHQLRSVTGIERLYPYNSIDSKGSLRDAIESSKPDLIIPCDDGVVWQLHELYDSEPALRPLIECSLGSVEAFPVIRSRYAVLQAAAKLGIRIPRTEAITSEKDLVSWPIAGGAVLKLDGTWGGTGVAIAASTQEALAEFRRMSKPPGAGFALKRWLVNSDPLALWSWRRGHAPSVTIQDFVLGRPANTMIACWQGEVLGIVTVEVITSQGATGAATVVRLIQNEEIEKAATLLARQFGLSGFHGLDFMIDGQSGAAYLIELNPRSTQLGHLRLPGHGDLAGALLARMTGEALDASTDCIHGDTVAFFPQTFNWNPKSVYLMSGYHDVPWEEPKLLRELLLEIWPERQWMSRLYHFFRAPLRQAEEAQFSTTPQKREGPPQ